ncbi:MULTISPECIES: histidinol-phosphate transaminase [unclassified Mesobacillus]|uniref:histidinol-phosphate transaminase n=1 Tax=unclassified Mesobacillus TaxID=2675270 RepID=UPI00203A590C|nr:MULTISPECIES: histidinol-phosphate transaminase [unclassified Mesobacillus]MCM3123171.1 histidinol-phosphate transaminase [Mesobacillus sp. MER 33]MCM3233346.1 histidinol-phosphate transaminase [Mesobacillus sp. MER 48]
MKVNARAELEGITPYALGQTIEEIKEQYKLTTVRKLSDNENVYGTSPKVREAILQASGNLAFYPDGMTSGITEKLSAHYGLEPEHFLVSNGSEEIIRLLTRAYIDKNDEAVMAEVTFPRYKTNVLIEGGKAVTVPMIEGRHDLNAMLEAITEKTKLVFVCNPNNPTGTIVAKQELLSFIGNVPSKVLVVMDEAYFEYTDSEDFLDSMPLLDQYENLAILRTFSKIYGLASLRIGYGIMHPEIAKELHKVRDVFNVNQLAQAAAMAAIGDTDFVKDCAAKNSAEREFLRKKFRELEIQSFPSQSNFLFAYTNTPVIQTLTENGVLVRQMQLPGYKEAFRITLGTREDHEFILHVVSQHFHERAV